MRGIYLQTHIYGKANIRDGGALQGAGRCDAAADPGPAADRRGLRLPHPSDLEHLAAEGVAPSRVPAPRRARRDAPRRALDVLHACRARRSGGGDAPGVGAPRADARRQRASRRRTAEQEDRMLRIERAQDGDADDVRRLLTHSGLPLDGLDEHLATLLVARDAGRIVGSAALEAYRDGALLRSLAV